MKEQIFNLIERSIINIDQEIIDGLYNFWNSDIKDQNYREWIQKKSKISDSQNIPEGAILNGIDLPFWFENTNPKRRIMIVGIDPLRNQESFSKYNASIFDDVIIGTPYAVHSKKIRSGRTLQYWNFIKSLKADNLVYLTDIFKTFFYTDVSKKCRSYHYHKNNKAEYNCSHIEILKKELEIIKPDIIITLGRLPYELLTRQKLKRIIDNIENTQYVDEDFSNIPVVPMVHLSGAVMKKHKLSFLEKNNLYVTSEIGISYANLITDFLEKKHAVN